MLTASPPTTTSNAELVRWSFERLNAKDLDSLRQLWTESTVERFPDRTCTGAAEIVAYFEEAQRALPDWHMEINRMVESGDEVFVRWHLTGTHRAPVLGVEGTGKRLALDGIDHFVIRDGKVVSNFVVFDRMQWAEAIGMLPPNGSRADRVAKAAFNLRTRALRRLRG